MSEQWQPGQQEPASPSLQPGQWSAPGGSEPAPGAPPAAPYGVGGDVRQQPQLPPTHPDAQYPRFPEGPGGNDFAAPPYQQPYYPFATTPPGPAVSGRTTIAGAVIQLVQSAFWLAVAIVLAVISQKPASFFDDVDFGGDLTVDEAKNALAVAAVIVIVVVAAMIVLAILTLRRVNGCRLASAIMQTVLGVLPLIGLLGSLGDGDAAGIGVGLVVVATNAVAATLLFHPSATRYCQARNRPNQAVPGY